MFMGWFTFSTGLPFGFLVFPNTKIRGVAEKLAMHIAEAAQEYDIEDNHDHDILSCKIPFIMSLLVKKRRGPRDGYGNDSYNMDDIVMPLHEYINHPIAMDIVHNGATFHV